MPAKGVRTVTDTDKPLLDRLFEEEERRSFMKKSAATAASVGLVGSGVATADGASESLQDGEGKALLFVDGFNPEGRFVFVSGVTNWVPNYGDVRDSWFSDYNTRMIRWLNSDEIVPMFVAQDVDVGEYDDDLGFVPDADDDPNQPQVYEVDRQWEPFGDNPRLVTVNFEPLDEDTEDQLLGTDDWWVSDEQASTPTTNGGN